MIRITQQRYRNTIFFCDFSMIATTGQASASTNICIFAGRKTQNEKTLHADLILAVITQLITVVLADKIHHHEYIRSLKPLIA